MADHILIIDDDPFMRVSLETELNAEGYHVTTADHGRKAIELAGDHSYDLVLTDVRMPDIDGLETVNAIRMMQPFARIIVMTAYASQDAPLAALKIKVDDYLLKPFSIEELLRSIQAALVRLRQGQVSREVLTGQRLSLQKLVKAIINESALPYFSGHSERVARLCVKIGSASGLTQAQLQNLSLAGFLHDIGMGELPPRLQEKEVFREDDFESIKTHPGLGEKLLSPFPELKEIAAVILCHHERWDGKGYPGGLAGEQIPFESRILAVAEAYDSLMSDRPHRKKRDPLQAIQEIRKDSGTRYDPRIVELFSPVAELYEQKELSPDRHPGKEEALKGSLDEKRPAAPGAAHTSLKILFFGRFMVMAGTTPLPEEVWKTRKARSLFAYLASRGTEVSEEKLMDLFWLEQGERARHSLHNCITVIRRIFTPYLEASMAKKLIVNRKGYYLFNREQGHFIDLEAFNELFYQGRTLLDQQDGQEGLRLLMEAEELYRGDFMEASYDEWSDDLRLTCRNRHMELLSLIGTYYFNKGNYQKSLDYWKKIVAIDNCYEDAFRGIMLSHVALGAVNEAVKAYHQCAGNLKKELSLPPPPNLMEMYLKIIEGQRIELVLHTGTH